jgi:hypothetical protein
LSEKASATAAAEYGVHNGLVVIVHLHHLLLAVIVGDNIAADVIIASSSFPRPLSSRCPPLALVAASVTKQQRPAS